MVAALRKLTDWLIDLGSRTAAAWRELRRPEPPESGESFDSELDHMRRLRQRVDEGRRSGRS